MTSPDQNMKGLSATFHYFRFYSIVHSRNLPSQLSKSALKPKIVEGRRKSFHILIRGIHTHNLSLISTWFQLIKWIWTHKKGFWDFQLLLTSTVRGGIYQKINKRTGPNHYYTVVPNKIAQGGTECWGDFRPIWGTLSCHGSGWIWARLFN